MNEISPEIPAVLCSLCRTFLEGTGVSLSAAFGREIFGSRPPKPPNPPQRTRRLPACQSCPARRTFQPPEGLSRSPPLRLLVHYVGTRVHLNIVCRVDGVARDSQRMRCLSVWLWRATGGRSASCVIRFRFRFLQYFQGRGSAESNVRAARLSGRDREHIAERGIASSFSPRCFSTKVKCLAEKLACPLRIFRSRV